MGERKEKKEDPTLRDLWFLNKQTVTGRFQFHRQKRHRKRYEWKLKQITIIIIIFNAFAVSYCHRARQ